MPAVETWDLAQDPIDPAVGFSNFEAAFFVNDLTAFGAVQACQRRGVPMRRPRLRGDQPEKRLRRALPGGGSSRARSSARRIRILLACANATACSLTSPTVT